MRKIIFTLTVIVMSVTHVFSQKWDRQMEVKRMDIHVQTDAFTATTFIEMEFYNPYDAELEGLYTFQLEPGQAIVAFQLDLFGQFRDGSIEEKWKARNAYNTIVGKRVDPALLEMNGYNNYSLRIYPVPAKGSRRITMTIQQLLQIQGTKAVYKLPLNIKDSIEQLTVQIKANNAAGSPSVINGLLTNESFSQKDNAYSLDLSATYRKADKPLSFSIPLSLQQPMLCIKTLNDTNWFALRMKLQIRKEYEIHPSKLMVYWDISAASQTRNTSKEISFLKQYVAANNIKQLTIITFKQQLIDTAIFYSGDNTNSTWTNYIRSFKYEGAANFGALDLSLVNADAILIFSDGKNSYGKELPVPGKIHVYCINSSMYSDTVHIKKIIGRTGGRYIDIYENNISEAVIAAGKAENILFGLKAGNTLIDLDENISKAENDTLFLSGKIPAGSQQLHLLYGNNGDVHEEAIVNVTAGNSCDGSTIDRIDMLAAFDQYIRYGGYWYNMLEWGKKEKVVTPYTSYIVLEKIEDYIKFNILPPKDLRSQCDMNIFVKADERRRKEFRYENEFEVLTTVANEYNTRIAAADNTQPRIILTEQSQQVVAKKEEIETKAGQPQLTGKVSGLQIRGDQAMMSEVVVTALGVTRQPKELGYSVSRVTANELTQGKPVNLQNGLTGKVAGLNVQTVDNGVFGDTRITLRGIRSLTGNNQPMLILDGSPVDLRYLNSINPNDVQNVTILRSPNATAIYGPDGVNGALVIQTKKGSRSSYSYYWSSYRLKDREDVEYMEEIKSAAKADLKETYERLKTTYGSEAGFYFDIAQYFYTKGSKEQAMDILFTAADISNGNYNVIIAMGYTLETWKEFKEAQNVYKELLRRDPNDMRNYRNLGLAYYQDGKYQQAVDIYYKGICRVTESYYSQQTKAMMLQEMNAIIDDKKEQLYLTAINPQLIRPIEYDMRITLDNNMRSYGNRMSIVEPGGKVASENGTEKTSGKITTPGYYYGGDMPDEYQVKYAKPGKYKIRLNYWDYYGYSNGVKVPTILRIITFKHPDRANATLEVQNVIMDNQYGDVEIAEVNW